VLSTRLAEVGEVVAAGTPVLRLAELDRPWVRAWLPEPDLARVKHGQQAEIRVDAYPDAVFHGTLGFVSPQAEFTPRTVETRELRVDLVYRIKIDVEDSGGRFKVGMPADVVMVPAAAP
jgi:HlyD family secretion protein